MGSLALVAKGKKLAKYGSESNLSDCELTNEENVFMVLNTKRFTKKKFPSNKNRN